VDAFELEYNFVHVRACVADFVKHAPPYTGYRAAFDRCWSIYVRRRSAVKFGQLSRSLKVVETDTDRSGNCKCVLLMRTDYEPISYHFLDKRR